MATMTHDRPVIRPSSTSTGLAFAVASAVSFGLSGALARGLLDAGWTAGSAVAVRIAIAALVLVIPGALALRGRWHLLRESRLTVIAYGIAAVAGAQLCFFYAVSYMQVGVALLIEYTAPVAVVVWLWLRHGNRPNRLTVVGAVIALLGLTLVLDVVSGADLSTAGVLWALGAMVGAATYFVINGNTDNGLPPISLAAAGLVVGGTVLLIAGWTGVLPMSATTADVVYNGQVVSWWIPVLALGLVTAAFAYVTGIEAGRRLGSRLSSFVALFEVLMALVFAWLLLGELPRTVQLFGGLLVLAGVVVVKLGEVSGIVTVEPLPDEQALSERPVA